MIMVIFGAGASYDSVPSRPPSQYVRRNLISRPPLATELFLDYDFFADSLRRFPQCKPIVPYLQSLPPGETIEHTLEVPGAVHRDNSYRNGRQLGHRESPLNVMKITGRKAVVPRATRPHTGTPASFNTRQMPTMRLAPITGQPQAPK